MAVKNATKATKPRPKAKKTESNLLDRAFTLGSSLVYMGKDTVDDIVGTLEKRDLISKDEGKKLAKKMTLRLKAQKEKIRKKSTEQLTEILDELGFATKKDIQGLKKSLK
jgi:polyhydroxyalkanoate synthesis regulator phasin